MKLIPSTRYLNSRIGLACCCLILGLGSSSSGEENERVWTSSDGREKVRAVLVSYEPRERAVSLELANGQTIQLTMKQLSAKDRHYLRNYWKNQTAENPDAPDSTEKKRVSAAARDKRDRQVDRLQTQQSKQRFGIDWVSEIPLALEYAKGKETIADDRPVMWFRVLGDLNGFM